MCECCCIHRCVGASLTVHVVRAGFLDDADHARWFVDAVAGVCDAEARQTYSIQVSCHVGSQGTKQLYRPVEASQEEGDVPSLPPAGQHNVRLGFLSFRRENGGDGSGVNVEVARDQEHGSGGQPCFNRIAIWVPSATLLLMRAMLASMTPGRFFCM